VAFADCTCRRTLTDDRFGVVSGRGICSGDLIAPERARCDPWTVLPTGWGGVYL